MEWVLILYIYAGAIANGDSVTLTTVSMETEKACQLAGKTAIT